MASSGYGDFGLYTCKEWAGLWSKRQQNRLFAINMLWARLKSFHSQPGRYKKTRRNKTKQNKQTKTIQRQKLQGSKALSSCGCMNDGVMMNRNRLSSLPGYNKNFWKLKDKWPGDAWAVDMVFDKAPNGSTVHSCMPSGTDGTMFSQREGQRGHTCMQTQRQQSTMELSLSSSDLQLVVQREVLAQRVSFLFHLFHSAAEQDLLPVSQLSKRQPQTVATQWAGNSHPHS